MKASEIRKRVTSQHRATVCETVSFIPNTRSDLGSARPSKLEEKPHDHLVLHTEQ